MRKHKHILILVTLLLALSSCRKANRFDCLKSTGDEVRIQRPVSGFHSLHLVDDVNLYISPDSIFGLEIEGGEHLLDLLETHVSDSILYISDENRCNWVRSYQRELNVYVSMPKLNSIWFEGTGQIVTMDTIRGDSLLVNLWGAGGDVHLLLDVHMARLKIHTTTGDIYASGKCGVGYYYSSSNGFIFAEGLETNLAYLLNRGSGDMYLHPLITLEAELSDRGYVYYRGDPVNLKQKISGSGRLVKLD